MGSIEERQTYAFLAKLGIDAKKLTPEELVTQVRILEKSKILKSPPVSEAKHRLSRNTLKENGSTSDWQSHRIDPIASYCIP